jgi:hypothetical protein
MIFIEQPEYGLHAIGNYQRDIRDLLLMFLRREYKIKAKKVIDPVTIGSINPMFRIPGSYHMSSDPLKKYCVDCERVFDLKIEYCECGLELLRKRIYKKRNVFANPISEEQLDRKSAEEILRAARSQITEYGDFWIGKKLLRIDKWDEIRSPEKIEIELTASDRLPDCLKALAADIEDHKKRYQFLIALKESGWNRNEVLTFLDRHYSSKTRYRHGNEPEVNKLFSGVWSDHRFRFNCFKMRPYCPQDGKCGRFHPVY